jgi:hypothetical protein
MPGKAKSADRLGKHLNEQVDAACVVTRPGAAASQAGMNVGGAIGAGISSMGGRKGGVGDIDAGTNSWLGLGPAEFTLTKGDKLWGKPKGEPFARIAYGDVASAETTEGKMTMRTDVALADGRAFAFEVKRLGPVNKPNVEVLEELRSRCGG